MSSDAQTLRLYNTLTRKKEEFKPLDPANVRMYVCGPTVYDFAHIGNARPVIVFDVLFRLLRHLYGDKHVTYVRNITDVDDKINARALRDHPDLPLNDAIRKVTETTATQFHKDVAALGCLEPTFEPRATEHIGGMIAIIETLIEKQHAYQAGGEVLFRVKSMDDYGQLSGRNLDDNIAGARVAVESHKENPADFVLWKLSSDNDPGWDSPWGRGRPGWHIECSAMSEALLGKTFDIHGGGLDLIFPHHENEIAQSRCAHGTHTMANYWMHNGYLQVEGKKMSKSEGNFVTIHDLLETEKFGGRKWPGEVLRLAMLMTHYREPIDFSVARLEEARRLYDRWKRASGEADVESVLAGPSEQLVAVLCDDMNTSALPRILNDIQETAGADALLANLAFLGLVDGQLRHYCETAEHPIEGALRVLSEASKHAAAHLMGRDLIALEANGVDFAKLNSALEARLDALNAKDFAKADAIRAELLEQGIQLMDYKDPETGERRTKWEVKR